MSRAVALFSIGSVASAAIVAFQDSSVAGISYAKLATIVLCMLSFDSAEFEGFVAYLSRRSPPRQDLLPFLISSKHYKTAAKASRCINRLFGLYCGVRD